MVGGVRGEARATEDHVMATLSVSRFPDYNPPEPYRGQHHPGTGPERSQGSLAPRPADVSESVAAALF